MKFVYRCRVWKEWGFVLLIFSNFMLFMHWIFNFKLIIHHTFLCNFQSNDSPENLLCFTLEVVQPVSKIYVKSEVHRKFHFHLWGFCLPKKGFVCLQFGKLKGLQFLYNFTLVCTLLVPCLSCLTAHISDHYKTIIQVLEVFNSVTTYIVMYNVCCLSFLSNSFSFWLSKYFLLWFLLGVSK